MRNVIVLERHVGKEVHDYMKEQDSGTDDQVVSPHYVESQNLLEQQQLPEGTRKVSIIVYSIISLYVHLICKIFVHQVVILL